ncbi:MAG: S4 domain-containing protein [Brevinema sp.]
MPVFELKGSQNIVDVLVESGLGESKSAVRRLIAQGAVSIDGEKITEEAEISQACVIRMGKLKFLQVK